MPKKAEKRSTDGYVPEPPDARNEELRAEWALRKKAMGVAIETVSHEDLAEIIRAEQHCGRLEQIALRDHDIAKESKKNLEAAINDLRALIRERSEELPLFKHLDKIDAEANGEE